MLPKAHIVHSMKNRARLRVPSKRKTTDYFTKTKEALSKVEGVEEVEINPLTGSILVRFNMDLKALGKTAEEKRLFKLIARPHKTRLRITEGVTLQERVFNVLTEFNTKLGALTRGKVTLRSVMGTTLVGLAITQAIRGNWLPPAWTLLDDALDFFESPNTSNPTQDKGA